jgi:hypothetical protein
MYKNKYVSTLLLGAALILISKATQSQADSKTVPSVVKEPIPCEYNGPLPPHVVRLPDGTEVPALKYYYYPEARFTQVVAVDDTRIFCSGVEGN